MSTPNIDVILSSATTEFLRLDVSPSKLPRMIQTRAHVSVRNCERPGRIQRLRVEVDLSNLLDHKAYLSETVRKPQYLKGEDRPLLIELTEDFEVRSGVVIRAGQRMVCGGIHRIAAAWELGWNFIPCRVLKVDAETAAQLVIRENSKPYKPARTARDYYEKLMLFKRQHGRVATINETTKMLGISRARVSRLRAIYPELKPEGTPKTPVASDEGPRAMSRRASGVAKRGLGELQGAVSQMSVDDFVSQVLSLLVEVVPNPETLGESMGDALGSMGISSEPFEIPLLPLTFVSD